MDTSDDCFATARAGGKYSGGGIAVCEAVSCERSAGSNTLEDRDFAKF